MSTCKVFIVGPEENGEEQPGYLHIRNAIDKVFKEHLSEEKGGFERLELYDPRNNPGGDNFNDWIFGQIDTSDLLVADITNFNPNVIYEVALAHALGVPCQYVRFGQRQDQELPLEGEVNTSSEIAHYFRYSLLSEASTTDEAVMTKGEFSERLLNFFRQGISPGDNLLTQYYGGVPLIDAEFTRGLAQTYCRNFLFPLLRLERDEDNPADHLKIIVPDTFAAIDSKARDTLKGSLQAWKYVSLGTNILRRPFEVLYESQTRTVYDLPSIVFTISDCPRFKKIEDSALFTELDKDRLTDAMVRKFVDEVRRQLRSRASELETLASSVSFHWLSELAGDWIEDVRLLNRDPLN